MGNGYPERVRLALSSMGDIPRSISIIIQSTVQSLSSAFSSPCTLGRVQMCRQFLGILENHLTPLQ